MIVETISLIVAVIILLVSPFVLISSYKKTKRVVELLERLNSGIDALLGRPTAVGSARLRANLARRMEEEAGEEGEEIEESVVDEEEVQKAKLKVICPNCGKPTEMEDVSDGTRHPCMHCSQVFQIEV